MNKFRNPVIFVAVLAGFALLGCLINSHASGIQAAGGPAVTIDPAQLPLQVTGSTTVSGAVGISGNTPLTPLFVREVGTTFVLLNDILTSTSQNELSNPTVTLDTSAAKTIRLNATLGNCAPCSPVSVLVFSNSQQIDQFTIDIAFFVSRVYEVPGTSLSLHLFNTAPGASNTSHLTVLARSN